MVNNKAFMFLVIVFLIGCSSTGVSREEIEEGLRKLKIGMTKQEVLKLMPGGIPRAAKEYPQGVVSVLEYNTSGFYYSPLSPDSNPMTGMVKREKVTYWLYFFNDKLVQWGAPNDWPTKPDIILEVRHR